MHVLDGDGNPIEAVEADPGTRFSTLARRPGTDEIWALQIRPLLGGNATPGEIRRFRRAGSGIEELPSIPLESPDPYGLAFLDGDRVWVGIPGRGPCVLDAGIAALTGSVQAALEVQIPFVAGFAEVVADPASGHAWWMPLLSGGALLEASLTGGTLHEQIGRQVRPRFVDRDGLVWSVTHSVDGFTGMPATSRSASADGLAARANLQAFTGHVDPLDGALWLGSVAPRAIIKVAEDGTLLDYLIESVDAQGAIEPLHVPVGLGRDGWGRLWAVSINGDFTQQLLQRFDLDATRDPSAPSRVLRTTGVVLPTALFALVHGSTPAGGDPPFAWVVQPRFFSIPTRILAVGTDGTITSTEYPNEAATAVAFSPRSNELCVATAQAGTVNLRRYVYDATVPSMSATLTTSFATSMTVAGLGMSEGAGGELCWIGLSDATNGVVRAYDAAGSAVVQYADTDGEIRDLAVTAAGQVWMTRPPTPSDPDPDRSSIRRIDFDAAGNPVSVSKLPAGDASGFIRP